MTLTLADIERAIRDSWSHETCDPDDVDDRSPDNPSRGQCGVTALVLHDLLGGDLVVSEVLREDGSRQGAHTWNRLAGGIEVDLTRQQFGPDEHVQPGRVLVRPDGPPRRCAEQYALLSRRVTARLAQLADSDRAVVAP